METRPMTHIHESAGIVQERHESRALLDNNNDCIDQSMFQLEFISRHHSNGVLPVLNH